MPVIGTFTRVEDGYVGSIATLSLNAKVAILPNAAKQGRNAPDFLIVAGSVEVGAAWRRTTRDQMRSYLTVKLDDPILREPIWGALLEAGEDGLARLIWRRDREIDDA
jgi:uncharacterized protein (DUF736 family)